MEPVWVEGLSAQRAVLSSVLAARTGGADWRSQPAHEVHLEVVVWLQRVSWLSRLEKRPCANAAALPERQQVVFRELPQQSFSVFPGGCLAPHALELSVGFLKTASPVDGLSGCRPRGL